MAWELVEHAATTAAREAGADMLKVIAKTSELIWYHVFRMVLSVQYNKLSA